MHGEPWVRPMGCATAATVSSSISLLRVGGDGLSSLPHHVFSSSAQFLADSAGSGQAKQLQTLLGNGFGYKTFAGRASVLPEDRAAALPEIDLRSADMFFLCIKRMTVTWMWCKTKAVL